MRIRRRSGRRATLTALVGALLAAWFWPAERVYGDAPPLDFARYELEIKGKLGGVAYEDLDGDGRLDVLVVRARELLLYFQEPTGFRGTPHQVLQIDPRAVIFDTVDTNGDGRRELGYLAADGFYCYHLKGRKYETKPQLWTKADPLTRRPSRGEIRRKDLCRDLNGDGLEDLLIPESTGLALHINSKSGLGPRQPLFVPPSASVSAGSDQLSSRLTAVYWYSNPAVIDFNRDRKVDLLLPVDDQLRVFPQSAGGHFPPVPAARVTIPNQKLLKAGERPGFDLDLTMPLKLVDLDRDGYVDLVSTHVGQGLTRLFMGSKEGAKALVKPSQTIRAQGVTFLSFTLDVDGDGLEDLIIPRMDKIGLWTILKVLVTRTVPVDLLIFFQRKERKKGRPYPDQPDLVREIEIPVLFRSTGDRFQLGTSFLATLEGDYNGDKRRDALYRIADDEIAIWYGHRDRSFSEDRDALLKIKNVSDYRFLMADAPDLNRDGRSDVVLRYYSWDRKGDRLSIFVSGKGKR